MRSTNKRSRPRKIEPLDEKIIISSEYYENDRPSYMCSFCNQTLSRLSDAGGNNSTYWCRNCSVSYDPAEENIRRVSKISVPDRNEETLVAQTPGQEYLKKKIEINQIEDGLFEVPKGDRTKCEKCGQIIKGRRRRLNQHKREHHSY